MAFKNNCAIKNKSLRGFCAKQKLRNNVPTTKTISAGTAQHGIFMFDNNKKKGKKRNAAAESGKANIQKNGYTI